MRPWVLWALGPYGPWSPLPLDPPHKSLSLGSGPTPGFAPLGKQPQVFSRHRKGPRLIDFQPVFPLLEARFFSHWALLGRFFSFLEPGFPGLPLIIPLKNAHPLPVFFSAVDS